VDWVAGAALLVRRSAIDATGGFDESYFLYSEETDWCYRIWKAGFPIWYVPEIEIVHYGGASTQLRSVHSYIVLYKSKIYFFERNYGKKEAIRLRRAFHLLSSGKLLAFRLLALFGSLGRREDKFKQLYEREKALSEVLGSVIIPMQVEA
jgi:hypothetical protein